MPATRPPPSPLERSRDTWRNLALGFAVLLFLVAWAWRAQVASIRTLHREQVQNWEQERAGRQLVDEERSRLIERLDSALDEMRRKEHHRTHPTTERTTVEE
jgi:hypothetical protein